jgi:glycosidase
MKFLLIYLSVILFNPVSAQDTIKVYPTHWWVGMKSKSLQLLIHAPGISLGNPKVTISYPGVSVISFKKFTNTDYLALDLNIATTARAGNCNINIGNTVVGSRYTINYQLKTKNPQDGRTRIQGITSSDFVYLIMPDRFSNGDTSNDRIPGYKDQTQNRNEIFHRHGGDLKGVQNRLDYLQDLGVTAIWLNPVLENDMPERSEHGYAFTDHYQVDKRLGGNIAYHELVNAIHTKGMKIIQDAVYNHVGKEHHLFRSLPDSSWFHWWPDYTNTTYKDQVLMDPYASTADQKRMSDGWFVPSMPDLNQKNPFVANFLIQHAIWSTEEFGLDGWRIDTYAYNDLDFMNRCNKALLDEFPKLHMFGETWVHGVVNQAYFTKNKFDIPFKSNLPGVTDFQLNLYGILPATTQAFGWTEGVNRLYQTMANDFVYANPLNNVIFLDNHDVSRFYSVVNEDFNKLKIGIAWLLTFRGIPQLYYGTEILMKNFANPDGLVRLDFPGGWPGDQQNKFKPEGRTDQENEIYNYTRSMANFRKSSSALKTGKTMQYVPEDGVYVYFRYDATQTVMCILNTNDREMPLNGNRFLERTANFTKGKDVITGNLLDIKNMMVLPPKTLQVLILN